MEKCIMVQKQLRTFDCFPHFFFSENLPCIFQVQKTRSYTGRGKVRLFPVSQEIRN
jgi:hypothetical protein